jgi:hypothetical protein
MKVLASCHSVLSSFRRASSTMRLRRQIDQRVAQRFSEGSQRTHLAEGTVWAVGPHRGAVALRVVRGDVWITESGRCDDIVRRDGEAFETAAQGKIVIHALRDSVIEIALAPARSQYCDTRRRCADSRDHDDSINKIIFRGKSSSRPTRLS